MKQFQTVEELIDFAISEEEASASFYRHLAGKMDRPWMQKDFAEFATEEDGHKAKLKKIKTGEMPVPPAQKVLDLKIGDYLVSAELKPDMDYQEALILAMKKEKAAFRMYSDLAGTTDHPGLKGMLLSLAQEEAKHKLRFEVEYDDVILQEN